MPKMVEIDEVELQQSQTLRNYVQKMLANPKAKRLVQEAQKLVDPQAVTPDLDQHQAVMEPIEEFRRELAAEKKAREDERSEREKTEKLQALGNQVETGIAKLRREGWTDAGIEAVRKIMEEQGVLNPELAAAYYEKQHPPAEPVRPGGQGAWNFMELPAEGGDADIDKLLKTSTKDNVNERVIDKMARDALADFRGQGRR